MKFTTAGDVLQIVEAIEQNGLDRSQDRAIINNQFNGGRPYTDEEVKEHQIQVNVNFLEGYCTAMDGNLQVNTAVNNKDKFFRLRLKAGSQEKREEWSMAATEIANCIMKDGKSGKKHLHLMKNRNSQLVLHGVGAMVWLNDYEWLPRFAPLDDLLIPTDAPQEFSDGLGHFGLNMKLSAAELVKLTSGPAVDKGWNKTFVRQIVKDLKDVKTLAENPDDWNDPEKCESLFKQHAVYLSSDAVPKVKLTYFFYQNPDTFKWHRMIILRDTGSKERYGNQFVYDGSETSFADDVDQIIHVQYGDGNVVAPLKFHSTRGLGVLLYGPVEIMNRLRCQLTQHAFESLMAMLRVQDRSDRDRPKVLQLQGYAVLEEGISFVPPEERHQANPVLVDNVMAQNKQLLAQSSTSYTQEIDNGTRKEQTLGEAQMKLQSANKVVAGMLGSIYTQEKFYYTEVLRRFMKPVPTDEDVKSFQNKCAAAGIPKELLKPELWYVDVEQVFGAGDQTLAIQEVTALMSIIAQLDPTSKRTVLRKYISTITRNHDLGRQLVPEDEKSGSKGQMAAEEVWPTLMMGMEVAFREGIEHEDYVLTMVNFMAKTVDRIQQTDQMGTPEDIIGLQMVNQDVEAHLQFMAQDPNNKAFVGAMHKAIGKMMNDVRAFAQRQQQALQAQQAQQDQSAQAESQAKVESTVMQAQTKNQIAVEQARLKAELKKLEHAQEMQQKADEHALNMEIQSQSARVDIASKQAKTGAEIFATKAKAAAAPKNTV